MKRLRAMKSGNGIRYYWRATERLKERGFRTVALGSDLQSAEILAARLNEQVRLDRLSLTKAGRAAKTELRRQVMMSDLYAAAFAAAKARSRTKGIAYELTRELEAGIVQRCKHACEVSGVPFSKDKPFLPSLDRIDSRLGYLPDNTRMVCWSVNIAMGTWGESALYRIARGVISRHKTSTKVANDPGPVAKLLDNKG